jgi:hypothetical protein
VTAITVNASKTAILVRFIGPPAFVQSLGGMDLRQAYLTASLRAPDCPVKNATAVAVMLDRPDYAKYIGTHNMNRVQNPSLRLIAALPQRGDPLARA